MGSPIFPPTTASGGGSGTSDHTALTNRTVANQHPASAIAPDTTNFNGLLSSADDTVQKALDTLDSVAIGFTNYKYVAKNGNDTTGDGSAGKPYLTISAAITANSSGTTLIIMPGTYVENITFKAGVYLTSPVKFGVYITGNHVCSFTGTVIVDGIILQSATGDTLTTSGANAFNLQILGGSSVNSGTGHAINWQATNASAKIYFEDGTCNVSTSGASACCVYATTGAAGDIIANRVSFQLNSAANIALSLGGALAFTHTSDVIYGQVVVSGTASAAIALVHMTATGAAVLTTNSSGATVLTEAVITTNTSPAIAGAGIFAFMALTYTSTGVGGAATLNGGAGASPLTMAPVRLRSSTLLPSASVAAGLLDGTFEHDSTGLYWTQGSRRSRLDTNSIAYGVLWNRASSSPTLQRIDENGDTLILTASNFNAHPLWGGIKRCNLTAAGVASYGTNNRGDGLTLTNDYTMVEYPLAYAGSYREGDFQGILLSDQPFTSKYCSSERHPAFWNRARSGTRVSKVYLGAYEAGANGGTTTTNGSYNTLCATSLTGLTLTSRSGVQCLTGSGSIGTMAHFEAAANAIGSGWGTESYWTRALLQSLFYIEYASFNSQVALAPGRTNASNTSALITGSGNSLMNTYGTGGGNDTQAVVYRGIENPWGNIWEFIIGLNVTDTEIRVMKRDGTGALADVLTNYEATSGIIPLNGTTNLGGGTDAGDFSHGFVKDLLFADPLKLGFFPSVLGGSDASFFTDYFNSHATGLTNILFAGGSWHGAGTAGVGYLFAHHAASIVAPDIGARLEFAL